MTTSSWLELFGSYAQTIVDNERSRLNAGITVKVSRGLSGAMRGLLWPGRKNHRNGQEKYVLKDAAASVTAILPNFDRSLEEGERIK